METLDQHQMMELLIEYYGELEVSCHLEEAMADKVTELFNELPNGKRIY